MRAATILFCTFAALTGCASFNDLTPAVGTTPKHAAVCGRARWAARGAGVVALVGAGAALEEGAAGRGGRWVATAAAGAAVVAAGAAIVLGEARGRLCEPPALDELPDAEYDAATRLIRGGRDVDLAPSVDR